MSHTKRGIRFLRTTAIGGLLFLLPLVVIGGLVGQVAPIVLSIAEGLAEFLPGFVKTPQGVGALILLAIAMLLLLCFGAGLLARRSFARNLSERFEKKLLLLFPRYAILKDQMADSIGGDETRPQMKPVLVRLADRFRIAFETERSADGQLVAVYLPGAPDPWSGTVALVNVDQVETLTANFGDAVASCEQLGRGATNLLRRRQDLQ